MRVVRDILIAGFGLAAVYTGLQVYRGFNTTWLRVFPWRKSASWLIPAGLGMLVLILGDVLNVALGSSTGPPIVAVFLTLAAIAVVLYFWDPRWAAPKPVRGGDDDRVESRPER